jgi:hypothetical protein
MSVQRELSGRRSVEVRLEASGTVEEVWRAIATGPGVSCWFVPCDVEEKVGGKVVFHWGQGIDSGATLTEWSPPEKFAYEEVDWAPGAPPLASEWRVEAKSGDACVIRLVHSLFASTDDWDNQLESMESGWSSFFLILQSYLRNFRGQPCVSFRINGTTNAAPAEAWSKFRGALAIGDPAAGARIAAAGGSPGFSGLIERSGAPASPHELAVVMDAPAPGLAVFGTYSWGGRTQVTMHLYHYGEPAKKAVATEAAWQTWMDGVFPKVEEAGAHP